MGVSETFKRWSQESADKDLENKIAGLEGIVNEIEGLKDIICQIKRLNESNIYKSLINSYKIKNKIYKNEVRREDFFKAPMIRSAKQVLTNVFIVRFPPFKGVVFNEFPNKYRFFEYFYYMNTNKPLSTEDMRNIYFGGLDERVFLLLDCFDDFEKTLTSKTEFFQKLKRVRWQKPSRNLFHKIDSTMGRIGDALCGYSLFGSYEQLFVEFLCFCAAVSDDRVVVLVDDVVRAYKTYFKLMKTDVTVYRAVERMGDLDVSADNSFFERFFRLASSDVLLHLWLRVWGLLFVVLGVLIVFYGYFPVYLGGLFLIFAGILSFVLVHRVVYVFYSTLMIILAIILYLNGYILQAFTLLLLSIFLFNIARVIGTKQIGPVSKNQDKGYLVCESCGGYYKLKKGESPDDFSKCQCGGELRYVKSLDNG
jgi:hypothetical protein